MASSLVSACVILVRVEGLLSGGKKFALVVEFKIFTALVVFKNFHHISLVLLKYPLIVCTLLMLRHFVPHKVKKYALFIALNEVPYDLGM